MATCFLLTLFFSKRKKVFVDAWYLRFLDRLDLDHFFVLSLYLK